MSFLHRLFSPYAAEHARMDRIEAQIKQVQRRLARQSPNFLVRYHLEIMLGLLFALLDFFIVGILVHDFSAGRLVRWQWYTWSFWVTLALTPPLCMGYVIYHIKHWDQVSQEI